MRSRVHWSIACLGMSTIAILYLPMVVIAVFSVNNSRLGLAWKGFTFRWYVDLYNNERIWTLTRNTLILAVVSTVISTVLGTLLALGISRFPWSRRIRGTFDLLVYLPVVTPDIVFAAAMVIAFTILRAFSSVFEPGMTTMVLAHVTFQVAFVALVVQSRLATIGRSLEEAARDLYASTWYLMRRVTLPLLMPAIFAGAMMAFTLSLDDFVISFFTAGPDSQTLPLHIYSTMARRPEPTLYALSTVIFLTTIILVLGLERLTRKEAR